MVLPLPVRPTACGDCGTKFRFQHREFVKVERRIGTPFGHEQFPYHAVYRHDCVGKKAGKGRTAKLCGGLEFGFAPMTEEQYTEYLRERVSSQVPCPKLEVADDLDAASTCP